MHKAVAALVVTLLLAGGAAAAPPRVDESQLLDLGFKPLVATTKVQQDWVRSLHPGKFRPMQRTGKKFFIYPDASRNQIYVGGPAEYDAYRRLHPEEQRSAQSAQDAAATASAYRGKQQRRLWMQRLPVCRTPFCAQDWADLGW